jgi:hypothetical protein
VAEIPTGEYVCGASGGGLVTRRRVLSGMAAFSAVSVVAGGAVVLHLDAPAPGRRLLSVRELAIVAAIGEVLLPAGAFPIDGAAPGVVAEVDRIVATVLEPLHARGFRYLLRSFEFGSLTGQGSTFSSLSPERRREVIAVWSDPSVLPRRIGWEAIRVVLGMAFFAQPEVTLAMQWRSICGGSAGGAA